VQRKTVILASVGYSAWCVDIWRSQEAETHRLHSTRHAEIGVVDRKDYLTVQAWYQQSHRSRLEHQHCSCCNTSHVGHGRFKCKLWKKRTDNKLNWAGWNRKNKKQCNTTHEQLSAGEHSESEGMCVLVTWSLSLVLY